MKGVNDQTSLKQFSLSDERLRRFRTLGTSVFRWLPEEIGIDIKNPRIFVSQAFYITVSCAT